MTFKPDFRCKRDDLPEDFNDLPEAERLATLNERVRLLHIYGQDLWHSQATIVGNTNALMVLRDAIDEALQIGKSETSAMVTDGEGYEIVIEHDPHGWQHQAWTTRPLPYLDPVARGKPEPQFDIQRLQTALRKANTELVKRGVKPVADPTH